MNMHQPANDSTEVLSPFKVMIRKPHVSFKNNPSSCFKVQLLSTIITTQVYGHRMNGLSGCWPTSHMEHSTHQSASSIQTAHIHYKGWLESYHLWAITNLDYQHSNQPKFHDGIFNMLKVWFKKYKHYSHKPWLIPQQQKHNLVITV